MKIYFQAKKYYKYKRTQNPCQQERSTFCRSSLAAPAKKGHSRRETSTDIITNHYRTHVFPKHKDNSKATNETRLNSSITKTEKLTIGDTKSRKAQHRKRRKGHNKAWARHCQDGWRHMAMQHVLCRGTRKCDCLFRLQHSTRCGQQAV